MYINEGSTFFCSWMNQWFCLIWLSKWFSDSFIKTCCHLLAYRCKWMGAVKMRVQIELLNDGFVSYKHATFHFTKCLDWSGLDFCDVFISCLDSHSDGTHSLQRIHWWASDITLNFSKSVLINNKIIYIFEGLRVSKCSANINCCMN